jgi:hypothetical protein
MEVGGGVMAARRFAFLMILVAAVARPAAADPPVASYIFPAGGRRGTTVNVRVGGLNLNSKAFFEMLGTGVEASAVIRRMETTWFEGPLLPLPDSQQAEDYPKDYSCRIAIAGDAAAGPRAWRLWTSQGASGSLPFVVGELPEIVEDESGAANLPPRAMSLPVTVNGRIFPREDVDLWSFRLRAGEVLTATVDAGRLGSPLDPWLEARDDHGLRLAESGPARGCDARLAFVAPRDGTYTIKIHDVNVKGGQAYVYRLSLTTGPSVATVYPLGGRRGSSVRFLREGLGLADPIGSAELPSVGGGEGPKAVGVRFADGGSAAVEVDDLPEALEVEPNDKTEGATLFPAPGVANGRIQEPGDVDIWEVSLVRGELYRLDLRALGLGSRLDPVLSILDPRGKELAQAEAAATGGDPHLSFRPATDGPHFIRIKDRFRSRGGPDWAYRLRLQGTPPDDFRLSVASDTLGLPRGGSAKLKVEVERLGAFAGPIVLAVEGLPEGVTVAGAGIGPGADAAELTFQAAPSAPIRSARLAVVGKAEIGGRARIRPATRPATPGLPAIDSIRLAVAVPTPFEIVGPVDYGWVPRGTVRHRRYKIARNGYPGPLEVRLADRQARHLQGVTGAVVTVPAGVDEFEYTVALPPWMEIGRTSRTVVMATGVLREPDGTEHEVSFSNPKAEIQIVAVVSPGRLGLEVGRASATVIPGRVAEVPVKIARGKGVDGPVRVEVVSSPSHPTLTAEPLILGAGREEGVVRLDCGPEIAGLRTSSIVLRASARVGDDPVTAEASLTLVADTPSSSGG